MADIPEQKTEQKNDDDSGRIVWHYSREHRLEHASAAVRELNEGKSPGGGPLRRIAGHRGNLFMLVAILIVCLTFVFTAKSGQSGLELGGNRIALSVTSGEDAAVLTVKKTAPAEGEAYTGEVGVAVSPVVPKGEEAPVYAEIIYFTLLDEERYDIDLPFGAPAGGKRYTVILQIADERIVRSLTCK